MLWRGHYYPQFIVDSIVTFPRSHASAAASDITALVLMWNSQTLKPRPSNDAKPLVLSAVHAVLYQWPTAFWREVYLFSSYGGNSSGSKRGKEDMDPSAFSWEIPVFASVALPGPGQSSSPLPPVKTHS